METRRGGGVQRQRNRISRASGFPIGNLGTSRISLPSPFRLYLYAESVQRARLWLLMIHK